MVYQPRLHHNQRTGEIDLIGRCEGGRVAWGFWGGVLIALCIVLMVWRMGFGRYFEFSEVTLAAVFAAIGVLLWRFGRRTTLSEIRLAQFDLNAGTLRLLGSGVDGSRALLHADDLVEVVFGMTHYPVTKNGIRIHAFSLLVRGPDDHLYPVVAATPHQGKLYEVAKLLSHFAKAPIRTVGRGVK